MIRMPADVENLVIGGGLAGASVALRLAAADREVLLLEREPAAHHKVCGEFLSTEAVGYLRQAGVDPLALGASSIDKVRLTCAERVVETQLPFTALSLSRQVLDAALLERAAQAGCVVERGSSVESLRRERSHWEALTRRDIDRDRSSGGRVHSARSVWLATGKHDVRGWNRSSGSQNDLVGFKMHWQLAPEQTRCLRGWMDLFLFPGGYGGLALVENDVANLCLVVRGADLRRAGSWDGVLAELLHGNLFIGNRLRDAKTLWARPLAISSIPYGYLAGRPAALWKVGDQAAVIPSFTGDGMSIALHSAALSADMYLSGKAISEYQNTLRGQLRNSMRLATSISRLIVTPTGRSSAPLALAYLPHAMNWIARLTRIPERALLREISAAGV